MTLAAVVEMGPTNNNGMSGSRVGALSLRTKLLLLILGVASSLVVTLSVLGLDAIHQTSETAQAISRSALEQLSRDHMIKITEENAARNSLILEQTMAEAGLLAAAASQYFSEPGRYAAIGSMQGEADLKILSGGQSVEGDQEQANLYLPNFVNLDAAIEEQVKISRVLDPLALAILDADTKAAAVYFISPDEFIRYYPKGGLELPPDFKVTDEPFYTGVLPSVNPERENRWTPVYDDPAGHGLMVSAIAPIYTRIGHFSGIIGIDFQLGDLGEAIETATLAEGSYSFLIDASGQAIALPNQGYEELLGRARGAGEFGVDLSQLDGQPGLVIEAMLRGERGVRRVTDTAEEKFIAYTPLGDVGWSLATVVATETVLADVNLLQDALEKDAAELAFKKLIPMAITILFIVTSLAFLLAYHFTLPLRLLTEAAAAIGRRQWDVELPHQSNDEVGLLSRTLADMAAQLKDLIGSLETRVDERTSELSEALGSLEKTHEQLSKEVLERQVSDDARADLEARFTLAFQNAPIGMALLDLKGRVLNPNPQLQKLFWPDFKSENMPLLDSVVVDDDQEKFRLFSAKLNTETISDEFSCMGCDGSIHQIVFSFSQVENTASHKNYIVLMAQDVTDARQMTEMLQQQANHDELTGLQNRRAFANAMQGVVENAVGDTRAHLLFLDLDQFKIVNDTCGHAEGDRLLIGISELVAGCVRSTDTVARLGGDEFAVLLIGCNQYIAIRKAEEIRVAVQQYEFYSRAELFRVGVSIGLVSLDGNSADLTELQQLADAACYAAKEAGRNRIQVVTGNNDSVDEQRGGMRWAQRLRDAMANDRFVLHGQRIQPLNANGGPEYIEVLLRLWDTGTQQLIPPGTFLPSAERYGLLIELDKWVVTHLVQSLNKLVAPMQTNKRFWVNLSGSSLGDSEFAEFLLDKISHSNLPVGTINFEVTETVVIRSMGNAKQLIDQLRDLGCEIALDDFGTGLSSLLYLKTLNVDCVKIDGSFVKGVVTDEVDRLFIKSTVDIARHLGIKTVAEFVENDAIKDIVAGLGADYGQGFGIHRPVDLFTDLLAAEVRRVG